MKNIELDGASIASYLSIIEQHPGEYRNLFRGQGNSAWSLTPSLYRTQPNIHAETIEAAFDMYENQCLGMFFREGQPYLPNLEKSYSNNRILAQHFGVPTRLLDWSRDPLVALFFAVEHAQGINDAAVFTIAPDARYLPEQVRGKIMHSAVEIIPPAIDRRIPAQKSVFTLHQYGDPTGQFVPLDQRGELGGYYMTGSTKTYGFAKIIIPARIAVRLRHVLYSMGIDRRNLFPGLEGVGQDIASRAMLGMIP